MRKVKNIAMALAGCYAMVGAVACGSDQEDLVDDLTLGHCLTHCQGVSDKTECFCRVSFSAQFNYNNALGDLQIAGLAFPKAGNTEGDTYPKMSFEGLPWSSNKFGWRFIQAENVCPQVLGVSETPLFKKLEFKILDTFHGETYKPGMLYDFEVEKGGLDYRFAGCCLNGKTTSTSPAGEAYVPEEDVNIGKAKQPVYFVDYDFSDMKADIYIYNAKFLSNMPQLNMVFEDVAFTVSGGATSLECASLVPKSGGIPFPSFPITNLKGEAEFSKGLSLEFNCDYRGSIYKVVFDGSY